MSDRCETCKFCHRDCQFAVCARFPPVPMFIGSGPTPVKFVWPPVGLQSWCGEYRKVEVREAKGGGE